MYAQSVGFTVIVVVISTIVVLIVMNMLVHVLTVETMKIWKMIGFMKVRTMMNNLLLTACRYGADDLHDGDILSIASCVLLNLADKQTDLWYAKHLKDLSDQLSEKQRLQRIALESVK